jgi:hypothetical protein
LVRQAVIASPPTSFPKAFILGLTVSLVYALVILGPLVLAALITAGLELIQRAVTRALFVASHTVEIVQGLFIWANIRAFWMELHKFVAATRADTPEPKIRRQTITLVNTNPILVIIDFPNSTFDTFLPFWIQQKIRAFPTPVPSPTPIPHLSINTETNILPPIRLKHFQLTFPVNILSITLPPIGRKNPWAPIVTPAIKPIFHSTLITLNTGPLHTLPTSPNLDHFHQLTLRAFFAIFTIKILTSKIFARQVKFGPKLGTGRKTVFWVFGIIKFAAANGIFFMVNFEPI